MKNSYDLSSGDSWAWAFTDLLFIGLSATMILAAVAMLGFNPILESTEKGSNDGPAIGDSISQKVCIPCLQNEVDRLRRKVGSLKGDTTSLGEAVRYYSQKYEECIKNDSGEVIIDYPLFLSVKWSRNNTNSFTKVKLFVNKEGTNQWLTHSIQERVKAIGELWVKGVDFVEDPDLAFTQSKLNPGRYLIYTKSNSRTEVKAEGYINFKSSTGTSKRITIKPFIAKRTADPKGPRGDESLLGTLVVSNSGIIWNQKNQE